MISTYRMHSKKTIQPNNVDSIDSNFDIVLKLEELRYVTRGGGEEMAGR